VRDKLFGFLTFEHQRFVIGQSGTATEPSVGWQNQAKALIRLQGSCGQSTHAPGIGAGEPFNSQFGGKIIF
jgi:hypothetical protein